jgi:hypothetical protein
MGLFAADIKKEAPLQNLLAVQIAYKYVFAFALFVFAGGLLPEDGRINRWKTYHPS